MKLMHILNCVLWLLNTVLWFFYAGAPMVGVVSAAASFLSGWLAYHTDEWTY